MFNEEQRNGIDYSKMPIGALKNLKRMAECALIRAEVDEDIDRYKRMHDKLDIINAEISQREAADSYKNQHAADLSAAPPASGEEPAADQWRVGSSDRPTR